MTGSMARKESAPERMGGVSEPGRQKQYLFTNSDLKRLIAPLIVEQILAVTVGMVDTMMVSSAGEAATSGVSLVDMINNLLINVFAAVSDDDHGAYLHCDHGGGDFVPARASETFVRRDCG